MAVERVGEDGFSVDGEHVAIFHIHTLVSRLALGVTVGRPQPGMVPYIQRLTGSPKRTSKGLLEDLVMWMYENGLTINQQWATVARALGPDRTNKLKRRAFRVADAKKQEVK